MINKYAEIRDRLALYNACKGVLRIKQAYNLKIIFFNRCIILMETFKYYENKISSTRLFL